LHFSIPLAVPLTLLVSVNLFRVIDPLETFQFNIFNVSIGLEEEVIDPDSRQLA
jgi:hypothetical protein